MCKAWRHLNSKGELMKDIDILTWTKKPMYRELDSILQVIFQLWGGHNLSIERRRRCLNSVLDPNQYQYQNKWEEI